MEAEVEVDIVWVFLLVWEAVEGACGGIGGGWEGRAEVVKTGEEELLECLSWQWGAIARGGLSNSRWCG